MVGMDGWRKSVRKWAETPATNRTVWCLAAASVCWALFIDRLL